MDREADRIKVLIVDTCTGWVSPAVLAEARAELLVLADETGDDQAADDAREQAAALDAVADTAQPTGQLSGAADTRDQVPQAS